MQLYLLLDTSGSMEGAKISALNDSMENIIVDLQEKAFNGNVINLSVLSFARDAKWMYEHPINILDFTWKPLSASGMTSLGKACCELAKSIPDNNKEPCVIVLLSDGCPTDDYEEGINKLHQLSEFKNAEKFAIALGENADLPSLCKFVDNNDNIFIENRSDKLLDALSTIINSSSLNVQNYHDFDISDDEEWG